MRFSHCRGSEKGRFFGLSLVAFRSSSEFGHLGAANSSFPLIGCLPCGFFPYGVFLKMGSHIPQGSHPLVKVPPQRFSHSRGFDPPTLCRPCFMPVPPLGFPLQGRFPLQSCTFSRTPSPLAVDSMISASGFCSLRVSLPFERLSVREAATLMRFSSLGISPLSPGLFRTFLS